MLEDVDLVRLNRLDIIDPGLSVYGGTTVLLVDGSIECPASSSKRFMLVYTLEMLGVGGVSLDSPSAPMERCFNWRWNVDAMDDRLELRAEEAIEGGRGGGAGIFEVI
jgi:hypothetical protein